MIGLPTKICDAVRQATRRLRLVLPAAHRRLISKCVEGSVSSAVVVYKMVALQILHVFYAAAMLQQPTAREVFYQPTITRLHILIKVEFQ